ncbi:Os09g0491724 [Oryza sativa Japonica Group]|uniref:Os09g0491724 protein n=1 Tax=Oryza sativa subsp. japonica TaxID=39947 RepID=A0A0P0XNY4_ORYSJ|nr:Os09g0491724 [Oryza sativa Japonica Group]
MELGGGRRLASLLELVHYHELERIDPTGSANTKRKLSCSGEVFHACCSSLLLLPPPTSPTLSLDPSRCPLPLVSACSSSVSIAFPRRHDVSEARGRQMAATVLTSLA